MNKVMRLMSMLMLHKAEEYITCIQIHFKQGFQKCSFYLRCAECEVVCADLKPGRYVSLEEDAPCDVLCADKSSCCDDEASCSCGVDTGHYACVCPPGHYGSGLHRSCKGTYQGGACHRKSAFIVERRAERRAARFIAIFDSCVPLAKGCGDVAACPNGTYSDGAVPGDESVCLPCPDANHVTLPPAASPQHCRCKEGFVAHGDHCEGQSIAFETARVALKETENVDTVGAKTAHSISETEDAQNQRSSMNMEGGSSLQKNVTSDTGMCNVDEDVQDDLATHIQETD
ncbi:hypothetical protein PR048_008349 [Dryococelus australis]|uniref:EGF-like domain-containing protein n=1 Tax=Dryococelus australis TaxID=614101 RepID=A0ABQ9HWU9_9NEOP|nr:hypothetical protein PR048_008349 [Dryococelus australis]